MNYAPMLASKRIGTCHMSEEKKASVKDLRRSGHRGKPEKSANQYGETQINTPKLCLIDFVRIFVPRSAAYERVRK